MTMMNGKTAQTIWRSQNILEPAWLTYSSLALHQNMNFSVPYSSFWKNHLTPIIIFPETFFVNQKSMTTNMAISSFITSQLNIAAKNPLKTNRPITMAFNTACTMKPRAGLGGYMSYYYCCSYCYSFSKSWMSLLLIGVYVIYKYNKIASFWEQSKIIHAQSMESLIVNYLSFSSSKILNIFICLIIIKII